MRDEQLAVVANTCHPLAQAKRLAIGDLASYRWVVYSANMPMRLLLEREFQDAGLPFPAQLIETTSAFATLSFLQRHPTMVALLSVDVARFLRELRPDDGVAAGPEVAQRALLAGDPPRPAGHAGRAVG